MESVVPDKEILWSIHNQNLTWNTVFGELIDNSFDAGARRVVIELRKKKAFSISDDGMGTTDTLSMLRLGGHNPHDVRIRSGRFGVGLKHAALWLWGETEIATSCSGVFSFRQINWQDELETPGWDVDSPVVRGVSPSVVREYKLLSDHGTRIGFTNISRRIPDASKIAKELSFKFFPAIKRGASIEIVQGSHRTVLPRYELPQLKERVDADITVAGKTVHLIAGLVEDGVANPHPGFAVTFAHRVLFDEPFGCSGVGQSRITGIVELGDDWPVTTNKDELTEHRDELEDAIRERCEGLFERADKQGLEFETSALEAELSDALNRFVESVRAKEKRSTSRENNGTKESTSSGRERKRATRTQPGDRPLERFKGASLRVKIGILGEDHGVGIAMLQSGEVILNESLSCIRSYRDSGNTDALLCCACAILSAHVARNPSDGMQKLIAWEIDGVDFEKAFKDGLAVMLEKTTNVVSTIDG